MEEITKELLNYGILGLWTFWLLLQNHFQNQREKEFIKVLQEIKKELIRIKSKK